MNMTFDDLIERLKLEDEVTLLEILDLSTSELVDTLWSEIYDKQERIREYYNEDVTEDVVDW